MARTVLVTGARGFVGTHLCAALAQRRPTDTIVALTMPGEAAPGSLAADLTDLAAVMAAVAACLPDVVVHLAAQSSVGRAAAEGIAATFAPNLGGSLNLALAVARYAPGATLLFASTSEVYGASFLSGVVDEASTPLPLNPYAKSKLLAEQTFAAVLPDSARLIVARPFNHTGPGQGEDFVLPSFARQIARVEAGRQTEMRVGNLAVRRDFLDVRDVVEAYLALIEAAAELPRRMTCNIASGEPHLLSELADRMCRSARVPVPVVPDAARLRPVDLPVACGSAALLRAMTGWRPRRTLATTLDDLLEAARRLEAGP